MDEDCSQFVPLAEERHSPSSHPDMDSYDPNSQPPSLTHDKSQSPGPFDKYSDDKENIDLDSNFTSSEALRTVIRRDGSPTLSSERKRMMEYVPGDNAELFTPAKTLNFTDADETGTDIDEQQSTDQIFGRYMKPNGADLIDLGLISNGSGNQRIIEGHDSSPMDHRVSVRVAADHGPVSSVTMSSGASHLRKLSVESQDISPNLYDSLDEKDDQVSQSGGQRQTQTEADISQRSQNIFSPLHSPNHAASSTLKDSPVNVFQGSGFRANRDLAHSSPQSEPPPSIHIDKGTSQFQTMSQSLPERMNHYNYEEFKNNLANKPETAVSVSSSESEWYTPSVSIVSAGPSKPPVNHIALNIQRVKNASKTNKSDGQFQKNGACPRANRGENRNNVGKNQPQSQNRQPSFVGGKSNGQPRPVVQGSAGHDSRPISTNRRQGQMNIVQGQLSSYPDSRLERNMGVSVTTGGRYGGVGSEFKGNLDHADSSQEPALNSPASRMRSDQRMNTQQSGFESHSLPASYVQQSDFSPAGSPRVHDREAVTTQMGQMRSPHGYSFSPQQERQTQHSDIGHDLQGMEDVRSHLQSMLRLSNDVIIAESVKFDHSDTASELLMDQPLSRQLKFDSSSLMGSRVQEEVSDLVENFPNLSSKIFSDMSAMSVGRQEASVHSENQYLRDTMEKERYRRKHCEQHIQQLNSKLLETQQQLAVAVSTDKRKDIMIEQLDKQLAKVVEGWKKREREKDDYLKLLMKEKSQIEQMLNRQQSMINNFEKEMADTVSELKREKETSSMAVENLRREVDSKTREKIRAEEVLEGERERASLVMQEWEQLKESRELAENRAQQLQDRLHKEQDDWYRREQELLGKIDDVKEANLKVIQIERLKTEETERRVSELEERKHTLDTETKRLELELDEVKREKESTKVEMAILEAKFESSQRKLEADLHAQMEKEISEQVAEVHQKLEEMQEELQEKHRRQVMEIHNRHQKDTERQIQQFHDDARRTEDNYRQKIQEVEERLTEYRNENSSLKHAKQKLESQRMEILTKFQYMMQSQWNEAVSLLVSTPHRKQGLNGSFVSSISQLAPSQPSNPPTNLNLSIVSSGQPKTSSPNREEEERQDVVRDIGQERDVTTDHRLLDTDRVEEYVNSLPTSSHSAVQQTSQGFLVSSDRTANNHSFSSENSGSQVPRHHDFDPSNLVYSNERGQGITFPELNLDQHVLSQIHGTGIPRNIHGYLVNQGSSIPTNQSSHLQTLANQNQAFYSLVTQPGAAVMLRPPHQQSHIYTQGQGQEYVQSQGQGQRIYQGPPSPTKHRRQRRVQRRDDSHPVHEYEDSDDGSLAPRPAYAQPGMSPPVKQSRQNQEEEGFNPRLVHRETDTVDHLGETLEETVRLNADYSQISERVAEHETRQNELQHYIKMLLDRPPGTVAEQPEHDIPLGSDILETSREMTGEIDLNDTAQAAQLNRELRRLQQLREQSQRDTIPPETETAYPRKQDHKLVTPGVLEPDQLSEISRLLEHYRHQAETSQQTDDESVSQLLYLLQHLPPGSTPQPSSEQKGPGAAGMMSPRNQRNKAKTGPTGNQKKAPPVTVRPTSAGQGRHVLDTSQTKSESGQSNKNQPQKKVERKLAGNKQPQAKSKHTAWK